MIETALVSFTTFFATIGPIEVALLYPGLTPRATPAQRRAMAIKATLIAAVVLVVVSAGGREGLALMGISLPALRIAGGILLMLLAIDMVFARQTGLSATTAAESAEAAAKDDVSVFPLATPLIAGPAAMGAGILLVGNAAGDAARGAIVFLSLGLVLVLTFSLLLVASQLRRALGVTGLNVITRVIGVALAALAVQFIIDGIGALGWLPDRP
ncbi:MAG: MarC family protein [Alphaproteobacteria bacterium]|nr:MarC family protein [Alphaproteobacteria bacterium]